MSNNQNELVHEKDLFDKVHDYYMSNGQLTAKEHEKVERWEIGFSFLVKHRSRKIAVGKLIKIMQQKGKSLSVPQAYKDIKAAEQIFAPLQIYTKDFLKLVLIESCNKIIRDAQKRAAQDGVSHSQWVKLMDVIDKAEMRIIKASGLDKLDPNLPDFSLIQPNTYNINLPKGFDNMVETVSNNGYINLSDLLKNGDITDIEPE